MLLFLILQNLCFPSNISASFSTAVVNSFILLLLQVKYLSLFGGTNVRETVNRLLKEVMANDLAVKYNFLGQKGKLQLSNLRIISVLYSK